jgi:hypothetical protein
MIEIEAKYGGVYHLDDDECAALERSGEDEGLANLHRRKKSRKYLRASADESALYKSGAP